VEPLKTRTLGRGLVSLCLNPPLCSEIEQLTARIVRRAGSMQLSGVRPSVCPSVPLACRAPLVRVCCCGPGRQDISIDCCTAGGPEVSSSRAAARRAAANAASATLSANRNAAEHRLVDNHDVSFQVALREPHCPTATRAASKCRPPCRSSRREVSLNRLHRLQHVINGRPSVTPAESDPSNVHML